MIIPTKTAETQRSFFLGLKKETNSFLEFTTTFRLMAVQLNSCSSNISLTSRRTNTYY